MNGAPIAWALNLEAEEELRRPGYSPSAKMRARTEAMIPKIAGLVRPGDLILERLPTRCRGHLGRAWCPTPRALTWLERAGAALPPAPQIEVLRRVNHRRFSAELGQHLEGAIFSRERAVVEARLASSVPGGHWLLKRPFGFGGAGRRRVRVGGVDPDLDRWLTASLREDGLQIEPWVERDLDVALHGFLGEDGALVIGAPVVQICDRYGAWVSSALAPPEALTASERRALYDETERAAVALAAAGYHGPFGVDAFRHRGPSGARAFNPRSEINARYAMGWAVGLPSRPDL